MGLDDAKEFRWRHISAKVAESERAFHHKVAYHSCVIFGNKIFSFFGLVDELAATSDSIYCYDSAENIWNVVDVGGKIPFRRYGHTATAVNDQVFLFGGWHHIGRENLEDDCLHVFDPVLNEWIQYQMTGVKLANCFRHSADYLPSRHSIIVFRGSDGRTYHNDLLSLDVSRREWQYLESKGTGPSKRGGHGSCVLDNRLYIFGGSNLNGLLADLYVLDFKQVVPVWSCPVVKGEVVLGLNGPSLNTLGNRLYLFAGYSNFNSVNKLWVFYPKKNYWVLVEDEDESLDRSSNSHLCYGSRPSKRYQHASVVTGQKLYILGGDNTRLTDIYELSPLVDE